MSWRPRQRSHQIPSWRWSGEPPANEAGRYHMTLKHPPPSSLCSCVSPLRCCSDFRPYFTIHDSEFKEYTTRTQAPSVAPRRSPAACGRSQSSPAASLRRPSVILGVTNPFFAKTLQHWPHIIRIGDMKQAGREDVGGDCWRRAHLK